MGAGGGHKITALASLSSSTESAAGRQLLGGMAAARDSASCPLSLATSNLSANSRCAPACSAYILASGACDMVAASASLTAASRVTGPRITTSSRDSCARSAA